MSEIVVRKCERVEEFHACVELQREIWGENDLEVEPATLFVVASHTGGQVLGAFDGAKLVGYTLAVPGVRNGVPYLHSHMTGVLAKYRDRGVGRLLKLFQREEALGRDIRLIEWTFDPLETRNAHFNLNRLGAICRRYLPNLYGITTSPLHRGLATDRLVAEWLLDSPRVIAAVAQGIVEPAIGGGHILLPVDLERRKTEEPERLADVQSHLRREFAEWFGRGYAAVALQSSPRGIEYVMVPWSDF
ncbi:MAG: acetyltransferase [Acidobacteria bacterium]|nr:acetyltransferase [Acidobacteriota bacterium]MBS1867605.1 acetyltransferase [Acidobacteriota bacterium]